MTHTKFLTWGLSWSYWRLQIKRGHITGFVQVGPLSVYWTR